MISNAFGSSWPTAVYSRLDWQAQTDARTAAKANNMSFIAIYSIKKKSKRIQYYISKLPHFQTVSNVMPVRLLLYSFQRFPCFRKNLRLAGDDAVPHDETAARDD